MKICRKFICDLTKIKDVSIWQLVSGIEFSTETFRLENMKIQKLNLTIDQDTDKTADIRSFVNKPCSM